MTSEKKIFLDRNDDVGIAVDCLIKASAEYVILNIPKESRLGKSLENFHILKRESLTAGKHLSIESVDDHVLELASLSKLEARNPVFRLKERAVADILPRYTLRGKKLPALDAIDREPIGGSLSKVFRGMESKKDSAVPVPRPKKERKIFLGTKTLIGVSLLFLGAAAFFVVRDILPRVSINLFLKKTVVPFSENVEVSSKIAEPDAKNPEKILLPGELLVAKKNLELTFDSHGKERIEAKAEGKLLIYNAYSSEPQPIVKGTRFESPEGKIFRLSAPLTIPPAKIHNGKIVPSLVEAAVAADEAGPVYNIPASKNWRIPGFKGTQKYDGFYAEAASPMTGGFTGEQAKPTEEDIKNGKAKLEQALHDALVAEIGIVIKDDLKLLDNALSFQLVREEIRPDPEKADSFSVFGDSELRYILFKESMLKKAIIERAQKDLPSNLKTISFLSEVTGANADFKEGRLVFKAAGSVKFETDIDSKGLRDNLAGVDEETLRAKVFALPGLEKATISLWPFWVKRVPTKPGSIEITAD